MAAHRARADGDASREIGRRKNSEAGQIAGLREAPAKTNSPFHDEGRLRPRQENASQLYPGRRPRRFAPAPGERIPERAGGRSRSMAERGAKRELDLRGLVRA